MRILYMGTPAFAVPSLEALIADGHQICGVFCQPDKPVGRHQNRLQPPPVKEVAQAKGIPVYQPVKLRDGAALEIIRSLDPELIVVAAYGRLLPDEILDYPARGCINVHSSLLPKYRGAAPINWAILNGERETGVTIMYMASELDAGDVITRRATPIGPNETAEELFARLAVLGAELLTDVLQSMEEGTVSRTPQNDAAATYAPMLNRELSPMQFTLTAARLHDQVRGLVPWPVATAEIGGVRCKVFSTVIIDTVTDQAPGTVLIAGKEGLWVACGGGTVLELRELQPDGGKRMAAADYLRGHSLEVGKAL